MITYTIYVHGDISQLSRDFGRYIFPLLGTLLGNHSVDFPFLGLIFQIGGRFFSFLSYFFTQQTSL